MSLFYSTLLLLLFLLSLPLQAAVAFFVWISLGRPIIFFQRRIGKKGKPFVMYKFRTMVPDADGRQKKYQHLNESTGPVFKIENDPRFRGIGKILSHTGLDELPQLWNVVRGDMALIGPRPLPVSEAKQLKPWMKERHDVLPGIISPAILTGKYHKNFDAWMKSDVTYVQTKTFLSDIGLLFRFVPFLVSLVVREVRYKHTKA